MSGVLYMNLTRIFFPTICWKGNNGNEPRNYEWLSGMGTKTNILYWRDSGYNNLRDVGEKSHDGCCCLLSWFNVILRKEKHFSSAKSDLHITVCSAARALIHNGWHSEERWRKCIPIHISPDFVFENVYLSLLSCLSGCSMLAIVSYETGNISVYFVKSYLNNFSYATMLHIQESSSKNCMHASM